MQEEEDLETAGQDIIKINKKKIVQIKDKRVKVYNKSVHLLTCGQFKQWLNMDLKKLLSPPWNFYENKIAKSQHCGLSRIEVTQYFQSLDHWNAHVEQEFKESAELVEITLEQINQMKKQFYCSVSLPNMIESYFKFSAEHYTFIGFLKNSWAIAYTYTKESRTFSGHISNKTGKSGSRVNFV